MAESTLYQKLVAAALKRARELFPLDFIIHYMDDILITAKNNKILGDLFAEVKIRLTHCGLITAPKKTSTYYSNLISRKIDKVFSDHSSMGGDLKRHLKNSK